MFYNYCWKYHFFKNKSAKTHFHVTSPMEERPNEGKLRSGNQIWLSQFSQKSQKGQNKLANPVQAFKTKIDWSQNKQITEFSINPICVTHLQIIFIREYWFFSNQIKRIPILEDANFFKSSFKKLTSSWIMHQNGLLLIIFSAYLTRFCAITISRSIKSV